MDLPYRGNDGAGRRPDLPAGLALEPDLALSPAVLARYGARVLDPATAVRVAGQPPIRSTVYVADTLLVSGSDADRTLAALTSAAASKGLALVPVEPSPRRREQLAVLGGELARAGEADGERPGDISRLFALRVRLEPLPGRAVAVDAWTVLQALRAGDQAGGARVGLDHLVLATRHTLGSPVAPSASSPASSYGTPGWGGRMPVAWPGAAPARSGDDELTARRPVVAVLDTGVGAHPWLPDTIVRRHQSLLGLPLGLQSPSTDPEVTGVLDDPLEGALDSDSGHGTFIAGLVRQICPDADLLSVRVMHSDGVVLEHDLLEALTLVALRQRLARVTGDPAAAVDVVSLSLGYYHEQPGDPAFDLLLREPIEALGRMGVAVVVAAGNDATSRPMYPAALTPYPGGEIGAFDPGCVPVVSVGALNPNRSIALFSNGGDWVACHRPGADLVSTFPDTFDASEQPQYRVRSAAGLRESLDPDDFSGGFGTWSGTSFAAPVLAAELALALLEDACGPLADLGAAASVARGWSALARCTGIVRP